MPTIHDINEAARAEGLSYGKFMFLVRCGMRELPAPGPKPKTEKPPRKYVRNSGRRVVKYDLEGVQISVYASVSEAAAAMGVSSKTIRGACNGACFTSRGYQWRYEGAPPPGKYVASPTAPMPRAEVPKVCQLCGKPYMGIKTSKYCSKEHAREAYALSLRECEEKRGERRKLNEERVVECACCGETFRTTFERQIYCSVKCRNRASGRRQSETKEKEAGA